MAQKASQDAGKDKRLFIETILRAIWVPLRAEPQGFCLFGAKTHPIKAEPTKNKALPMLKPADSAVLHPFCQEG